MNVCDSQSQRTGAQYRFLLEALSRVHRPASKHGWLRLDRVLDGPVRCLPEDHVVHEHQHRARGGHDLQVKLVDWPGD